MIGDESVSVRVDRQSLTLFQTGLGVRIHAGRTIGMIWKKGERQATPLLGEVGIGDGLTLVESLSSTCNQELV